MIPLSPPPFSHTSFHPFEVIKKRNWYQRSIAVLKWADGLFVGALFTASFIISAIAIKNLGVAVFPLVGCLLAVTALGSFYFLRYRIHRHFRHQAADYVGRIILLVLDVKNDVSKRAEIQTLLNPFKQEQFKFLETTLIELEKQTRAFLEKAENSYYELERAIFLGKLKKEEGRFKEVIEVFNRPGKRTPQEFNECRSLDLSEEEKILYAREVETLLKAPYFTTEKNGFLSYLAGVQGGFLHTMINPFVVEDNPIREDKRERIVAEEEIEDL